MQLFSKGSGRLLYEILDDLFDYCFPIRQDRAQARRGRGRHLRGTLTRRGARHLRRQAGDHQLRADHQAAAGDTPSARRRAVERFLPEDLELYFDDIVDASERIWDLLDNYKEVVEALEATNESVITHRLNDVLRVLTV